MSTKPINYNLVLPEQEDYYDVDIFNENYSVIDTELKRLSDETGGLSSVAHSGSYKDLYDLPSLHSSSATVIVGTADSPGYDGMEDILYDGSTECMKRLNTKIGELTEGGVIYFKPGTYSLAGALSLKGKGIKLCGSGMGTVINCDKGRVNVLNRDITIADLCIESNTAPASDTQGVILLDKMGIDEQADGFGMFNVTVKYMPSATYGALMFETSATEFTGIRLVGCTFESASQADKVRLIHNSQNLDTGTNGCVSGCIAKNSTITAIDGFAIGGSLGITNDE
jgi:hypothetical protein